MIGLIPKGSGCGCKEAGNWLEREKF